MASYRNTRARDLNAMINRALAACIHLYRSIFRNDIFLAYSRADGKRYTSALAAILISKGYLPLMDSFHSQSGEKTPKELLVQLRHCVQLVVVASPSALQSREVTKEVRLFPKRNRSVAVIQFDRPAVRARWASSLPGISPEQEAPERLEAGQPSEQILDLIANAYKYRKQRARQQVVAAVTATFVLVSGFVMTRFILRTRQLSAQNTRLTANNQNLLEQSNTLTGQLTNTKGELANAGRDVLRTQAIARKAQNDADEAGKLADARRTAAEIDQARRITGYTTADHLQAALDTAEELNRQHLVFEASSLLADSLATSPKFIRTFPIWASPSGGAVPAAPLPGTHTFLIADGPTVHQYDYLLGKEITPPLQHESAVKEIRPSSTGNVIFVTTESSAGYFH